MLWCMKQVNRVFVAILMASTLMLVHCRDDDEEEGDGIFTAKYDGVYFKSDKDEAYAILTKGVGGSADIITLSIRGSDENAKRMIHLTIQPYTSTVTYFVASKADNQAFYYENYGETNLQTWSSPDYDNPAIGIIQGDIIVTELTAARVKGTFQFPVFQAGGITKQITEGSFDVPLTRQGF